ncbi:thiamine-triphosphatase-like [Oculina patagonica]
MAADLECGTLRSPQKIEVESKFRVPPDFERLIQIKGAKLLQQTSFTDVYFDSPNHELTLSGLWLRKRDLKWELKIQKLKKKYWIESNCEIEDETEIVKELLGRLTAHYPNVDRGCTSVEDIIQNTCCKQIACFSTHRTVYEMPNGVLIDLDQACFGYRVGELEVVVTSEKDIDLAEETIQKTATLLGIECKIAVPGKVEEYLLQNSRSHYEQLVKNGYFIDRAMLDQHG